MTMTMTTIAMTTIEMTMTAIMARTADTIDLAAGHTAASACRRGSLNRYCVNPSQDEVANRAMNRRRFLTAATSWLGVTLACAIPAQAQSMADPVVNALRRQGYTGLSVSRTWLGRLRITAENGERQREIILNGRTGEVLRDVIYRRGDASSVFEDSEESEDKENNSGSSNSGSGNGSDDDDDDESDNSGSGSDNSGSGSDNSGSGNSGDDDDDDDD
jgi:hypothetical protein